MNISPVLSKCDTLYLLIIYRVYGSYSVLDAEVFGLGQAGEDRRAGCGGGTREAGFSGRAGRVGMREGQGDRHRRDRWGTGGQHYF